MRLRFEQSVAGVVIIAPLLTAAAAAHSLPTGIPAVVVESDAAGDLTAYDEVVVCNDTYVFALDSYEPVFAEMATRPCDF